MEVVIVNSPWHEAPDAYGVKAGSRWPSIRKRSETLQYYPYPFFSCYAVAVLKREGIKAKFLDAIAGELSTAQTMKQLKEMAPKIVVIETGTPSIYQDWRFAKLCKKELSALVLLAGPHVTALPVESLAHEYVDGVLLGEYEMTLLQVYHAYMDNGDSWRRLAGIAAKDEEGNIINNGRRELIEDLDSLPYPERDDVPLFKYTDPTCKKYPNVCLIASRGCPFRCIFCIEPYVLYGKPSLRYRDPVAIVDEIEYVLKRYDVEEIYFDDSSFTTDKKKARAVAEEILKRGVKVYWSCMADARIDEETLRLMKRSGCHGVKFGVETASEHILRAIKKPLKLEEVRRFVDLCRKVGIYTHGTFMFGLPGETEQTIKETMEFAYSLRATTYQFSVATPLPGTEFYEMAKQNGWLTTDDWSSFEGGCSPVIEYPLLKRDQIVAALEEAKRRRIGNLLRNPAVFFQYLRKIHRTEGTVGMLRDMARKGLYYLRK